MTEQLELLISPGIAPEYDPTKSYSVDDFVLRDNKYWVCIKEFPQNTEWSNDYWKELDLSTELSGVKKNISDNYTELNRRCVDLSNFKRGVNDLSYLKSGVKLQILVNNLIPSSIELLYQGVENDFKCYFGRNYDLGISVLYKKMWLSPTKYLHTIEVANGQGSSAENSVMVTVEDIPGDISLYFGNIEIELDGVRYKFSYIESFENVEDSLALTSDSDKQIAAFKKKVPELIYDAAPLGEAYPETTELKHGGFYLLGVNECTVTLPFDSKGNNIPQTCVVYCKYPSKVTFFSNNPKIICNKTTDIFEGYYANAAAMNFPSGRFCSLTTLNVKDTEGNTLTYVEVV